MKKVKKIVRLVVILFVAVQIFSIFGVSAARAVEPAGSDALESALRGEPAAVPPTELPTHIESEISQEQLDSYGGMNSTSGRSLTDGAEASAPGPSIAPTFHVDQYLKLDSQKSRVPTTATAETGIIGLVVYVIDLLIKFIGGVALIIFIIGALMTIIAQGKEDLLEKGKKTMLYAIYGLIIAFTSYIIVTTVQSVLF